MTVCARARARSYDAPARHTVSRNLAYNTPDTVHANRVYAYAFPRAHPRSEDAIVIRLLCILERVGNLARFLSSPTLVSARPID